MHPLGKLRTEDDSVRTSLLVSQPDAELGFPNRRLSYALVKHGDRKVKNFNLPVMTLWLGNLD
jgi:hypothetical protein